MQALQRHRDQLLEGAVAVDAHGLVALAGVDQPAAAGVAGPVLEVGDAGDHVADGEVLGRAVDLEDLGRELVPRHPRIAREGLGAAEGLDVRPADAGIADAQQRLPGPGTRILDLDDVDLTGRGDMDGAHQFPP